jgi:hypothetical protein
MYGPRWTDWVWHYGWWALVAEIACGVLLCASDEWPTVLVAMVATGIAWYFGRRQIDLQEVIRLLAYMPVLTGDFPNPPLKGGCFLLHNAGNGPAMDVRATVLSRIVLAERGVKPTPLKAECSRSHVGPKEDACVSPPSGNATPSGGSSKMHDVWIVHCGDVSGRKYHLVSNSTGNGPPGDSPDGTWRWWRENQAPSWVFCSCHRCQELAAIGH